MTVDTLQLIHDCAYVICTLRYLDSGSLLYTHTQGMTALVCTQIVKPVCHGQCLRISEAFAHLLYATMDVAEHGIHLAHDLTVERGAHPQHAMGRRMLGADADDELVFVKDDIFFLTDYAVGADEYFFRRVCIDFVLQIQRIGIHVIVLSQRVSHPVLTEEKTPHVGMVEEAYAIEVIDLAFLYLCRLPQVAYRWEKRILAVGSRGLESHLRIILGRLKIVEGTEFVAPVHAYDVTQIVHRCVFVIAQRLGDSIEVLCCNLHNLPAIVDEGGRRSDFLYFVN